MKVAVYGKSFNSSFHKHINELFLKLKEYKCKIIIYKPFLNFIQANSIFLPEVDEIFHSPVDLKQDIDIMISIGGDGTFLEAILYIGDKEIPIIGINSGRLGFLANISKEEIPGAIDALFKKEITFESRSLIQVETPGNKFGNQNYGLNEVTFQKVGASMITVQAYVNDDFLNTYWADGLIISTPTGSTAYSLGVGGPIIFPQLNNLIIAPIAPHNLSVRPIIVPDDCTLKFKITGRQPQFITSLDHRSELFTTSAEIIVKKMDFNIKMIKLKHNNFFSTLRNKLMWGMDKRN